MDLIVRLQLGRDLAPFQVLLSYGPDHLGPDLPPPKRNNSGLASELPMKETKPSL